MRAALLCIGMLLVAASAAAVEPPQCRHLKRQMEYYSDMQERADELGNDLWVDRLGDQIFALKSQRRAIHCKATALEKAEFQIAELTALLKAAVQGAAQGAVTFFTMGAM